MTDRIVVDTNVLIVANGNNDQADPECELACIEMLEGATKGKETVLLDASGLIMDEYEGYCSYSGVPGVGDLFFKFLHDHQYSEASVVRIPIQQTPDREGGFANLPPNDFDPNDRKFLAVAEAGNGRVVNATDSHWSEHADFIDSMGVFVCELCPQCLK